MNCDKNCMLLYYVIVKRGIKYFFNIIKNKFKSLFKLKFMVCFLYVLKIY